MAETSLDLVLVHPADEESVIQWLTAMLGGAVWLEHVTRSTQELFARIGNMMETGDTVWRCRSRHIGVLFGNEGLAIVRNGEIIHYENVITY